MHDLGGTGGLGFHQWCRRIVHRDLTGNPVDFEQREGRIARYASLALWKYLGELHGSGGVRRDEKESCFSNLLLAAGEQPSGRTGLERWWLPERGRPVSLAFDWRFSLRPGRKEQMLEEPLHHRLALGQPDPQAFLTLKRVGADDGNPRDLATRRRI